MELKKLLYGLQNRRPDICIRVRLQGEMWMQNFMRIVLVSEMGLLLHDESANKLSRISGLENIIQFEIDRSFEMFEPHFHYDVVLSGKIK